MYVCIYIYIYTCYHIIYTRLYYSQRWDEGVALRVHVEARGDPGGLDRIIIIIIIMIITVTIIIIIIIIIIVIIISSSSSSVYYC